MSDEPITIDIWGDIACPWCYITSRRLDRAAEAFAAQEPKETREVRIRFHSFELAPDLPLGTTRTAMEYNRTQMGMSETDSAAVLARVARRARAVDIDIDFDTTRVANTVLAHQVIHYAQTQGVQRQVKEALYAAYFTQGRDLSDIDELADVAASAGLDRAQVRRVLMDGEYLANVRADEEAARQAGIRSVPLTIVDGKYALAGAQETNAIMRALDAAWADRRAG